MLAKHYFVLNTFDVKLIEIKSCLNPRLNATFNYILNILLETDGIF